ncbi:MAG: TIGR00730 family Rossman fold protein [Verrucomicrobia bacterium]|nr:TIGR00730 family Rossman fold protein [Verrucomicrobiota bacterium]
MSKLLCVYCASSRKLDPKYHEAARAVGRGMVERGWGLVYGGGNVGLMGEVAAAVKGAGGRVVGVIPEFMIARELAFREADELITVGTMRERKQLMEERAAAFLTLPGGIGTLEELTEIMTLRYINLLHKPIVLLNQDGFYDDLLRFFERMTAERFKSAGMASLLSVAATVDEVWPLLEAANAFEVDAIWQARR